MAGRIARIVQIFEHCWVLECGEHEVLEMTQRMRPDRPVGVVPDQPAHVRLRLVDAEVVQPEPHHLLLKLRRRVDGAEQLFANGAVCRLVALHIELLACLDLVVPLDHGVDGLAPRGELDENLGGVRAARGRSVDLRGDRRGKGLVGAQLPLQIALTAQSMQIRDACGIDAEGDALQPQHVPVTEHGQRRRRGTVCGGRRGCRLACASRTQGPGHRGEDRGGAGQAQARPLA